MSGRAALLAAGALALLPAHRALAFVPPLRAPIAAVAPAAALAVGNRLFRAGRFEEAMRAYAGGYRPELASGRLTGLLAYNLGTAAQRLGRLPEAVLWYRRAQIALSDSDPWLRDNLALARQAVAAPEPAAEPGFWVRQRRRLLLAGTLLAWAALPLLVLPGPPRLGLIVPLALLSAAAFAAGLALSAAAPRAAVVMAACPAAPPAAAAVAPAVSFALPAGSEVWVTPVDGGGWHLLGEPSGQRCPSSAVALVEP